MVKDEKMIAKKPGEMKPEPFSVANPSVESETQLSSAEFVRRARQRHASKSISQALIIVGSILLMIVSHLFFFLATSSSIGSQKMVNGQAIDHVATPPSPAIPDYHRSLFVQIECLGVCPSDTSVVVQEREFATSSLSEPLVRSSNNTEAESIVHFPMLKPGAYTARIQASPTICWEADILDFEMNDLRQVTILRFVQKGFRLRVDVPDWLDELQLLLEDSQQLVVASGARGPCLAAGTHTFTPIGNMQFQLDKFTWSTVDPQPVRLEPTRLLVEGRIQAHAIGGEVNASDLLVEVIDGRSKAIVDYCRVQQSVRADVSNNTDDDADHHSLTYSFWMPQKDATYVVHVHSVSGQQKVTMLQSKGVVINGLRNFSEVQLGSVIVPTIYTVIESSDRHEKTPRFIYSTPCLVGYAIVALLAWFRWPLRLFGNGFWHTVVSLNLPLLCLSALGGVSSTFLQGYLLGCTLFTLGWHLRRRRSLMGLFCLLLSHIGWWIVVHLGFIDQVFLLPFCALSTAGWRFAMVDRYLAI